EASAPTVDRSSCPSPMTPAWSWSPGSALRTRTASNHWATPSVNTPCRGCTAPSPLPRHPTETGLRHLELSHLTVLKSRVESEPLEHHRSDCPERTLSPFLVAASSGLGEEALAGEASEAA